MLKIGITGGIGSGKSTIATIFKQLGIPVYSSDLAAKKIFVQPEVQSKMIDAFGSSILDVFNKVDRTRLSKLVFNNSSQLEKLNAIIHPAVAEDYRIWLNKHSAVPYTLKEAAILFESGAYKQVDKIITIGTPLELRINRVMKRDGLSRQEIETRINNQWSDEQRAVKADFVIVNNDEQLVIPQVLKIHEALLKM